MQQEKDSDQLNQGSGEKRIDKKNTMDPPAGGTGRGLGRGGGKGRRDGTGQGKGRGGGGRGGGQRGRKK